MITYIIKINGVYDILCALCILKVINIPFLNNLHLSMIIPNNKKNDENEMTKRFFAYWIFTYGIIRISECNNLISCSYFIEAIFIMNELKNKTMYINKALFVILTSLMLGYIS
jgi:hypothetical protein